MAWVDGAFRFLDPKTPKSRRTVVLPDIRFHDLRHTCASLRLAAGENMSTTADTYAHTLPGQHRQAAETMDRILDSRD